MAKCPECSVELASVEVRGVGVRTCSECGGIWFDRDRLTALQTETILSPVNVRLAIPRTGAGECPRCTRSTLSRGVLSDHAAAVCSDCGGVWVPKAIVPDDRREAGDIVAAIIEVLSFFAPFF